MYGQPYYGPAPPQSQWPGPSNVVWVPMPADSDVERIMKLLDKIERRRLKKEEEDKKTKAEKEKKDKEKKPVRFSPLEVLSLVFIGYFLLTPLFKLVQHIN